MKNCDKLNWSWIEEKLVETKLDKFAGNVFALIDRWFSIKAPILQIEISDEFYETATEKILSDGVFGFCNDGNGMNVTINAVKDYRTGSGFHQALLKIFPRYKEMAGTEQYKFLAGKPYLLPIAWIYRFWYCIRHRKIESGKKMISNANIKRTDYERRMAELSQWGLV